MSDEAKRRILEAKESRAKKLDLRNCGLTIYNIPNELWRLKWLEELDISNKNDKGKNDLGLLDSWLKKSSRMAEKIFNEKKRIPFAIGFEGLKNLKRLNLSNTNFVAISILKKFSKLQSLSLNSNNISDISALSSLPQLQKLYLDTNEISDISVLSSLPQLQRLSLRSNNISDISVLIALSQLKALSLSSNNISDISVLGTLSQLQTLYLSSNNFLDLSSLKNLSRLQNLSLRSNNISDISILSSLSQLQTLDLRSNNISDISILSSLSQLQTLNLRSNSISDISVLSSLSQLHTLELSSNNISDISVLSDLNQLQELDLTNNNISDIKALVPLIAEGIQTKKRKKSFVFFFIRNKTIVDNNPLQHPPIEIVKQGNEAILNYFKELESDEEVTVHEAKLLIIGEAGVGKTTFARKLVDSQAEMPDEQADTTKGVQIYPHTLAGIGEQVDFLMNIWDFGGQEIYHSTHQFFLSKRSLYVLLLDGRIEENPHYWLQVQDLLGADSPLLMVMNKKGTIRNQPAINEYKQYYDNFKEFKEVNLKEDTQMIASIQSQIAYQIRHLPHFERGERLPGRWNRIRSRLKTLEDNYIDLRQYRQICAEEGIEEHKRQDFLSDYLHDLGAMLHFTDEPLLRRMIILKPQWATEAVYKVLDHTKEQAQVGHFQKTDLDAVWSGLEYVDVFDELLTLMEKFELCYQVPHSETYIVPQLLPDDKPSYDWSTDQALQLRYQYDFMPKGIVTRLIVRLHRYIQDQSTVWKRGAIFEKGKAKGEVHERFRDKQIHIRIIGAQRKELMSIIAHEIDAINSTFHFNERTQVHQLIPCNCKKCVALPLPHFYKRGNLERRKELGKRTTECEISFEDVDVLGLLEDVFVERHFKRNPEIQQLLMDNRLQEAIEKLTDQDMRIMLMGQWKQLKQDHDVGTLSRDEFDRGLAKLRKAILGSGA